MKEKHLRGLAMLVPLKVATAFGEVPNDDMMSDPGA
jgi:hypothetical protein